ncbi:MAG TPA: tetratricopeptide repeat protein [Pyrinomonadaceae bacterium]|jgi:tetratricopeptide (TPR) repeat protein|nr:tetratricopeptide repeat protein [Pyrinomonadaceae bacterium]
MKRFLTLAFILCAACPVAFAQREQQRADIYYRDGARFTLEGRLEEAARAFEQAVALDPSNGNAYYSLGNVYSEMGHWADAVIAYNKAVSLNKDDVEAYNNLGIALAERGQYVQAAAAFEKAVKIYPKWAEPFYRLSRVRRALHDEEEAREAYDKAIRLRPDYATSPPVRFRAASASKGTAPASNVASSRGGVLKAMNALNLGDQPPSEANASPSSVASAEPPAAASNSAPAETNNASPPPVVNNPAPAPTASAAAKPEASDSRAFYELGVRESRAGHHAEAVKALRQAVLLDRNNAAAYVALGDAYAAAENWPESVDAYEQAARINPDDPQTYERLGRSFAKLRSARTPETATRPSEAADVNNTRPDASPSGAHVDDPDPTAIYRVGPGDVLDIRLLDRGAPPSTTAYEVTPTGLLSYPTLAEPLKVGGLTADQIAARLGAQLKLRADGAEPEIAVGVRDYASHAVILSGMVKEPGTVILQREGVPLYVVIAYAQPLAGAGQALVVSRATGRSTIVDLSDAAATKMLVRPGDVITLKQRPEQFVYVSGAVRQPGQKRFQVGLTLTQAVMAAGGTLSSQGPSVVSVTRQDSDRRLTSTRYDLAEIKAGKTPDPLMRAGDRVEVIK